MDVRYSFQFNRDPNLRAGDADREATGDRLRKHHAEGRLDAEEFQDRIDRCYAAKTIGELDELVGDLPREPEEREHGYVGPFRRAHLRTMIPFTPILIALIVASALTGWHGLWLAFPLFFLSRMWIFRRARRGAGWRRGCWDGQPI
jgi:hypothetical protein